VKILQVVHDYLPEHVGGTEVHAHQVACVLSAKGHDVVCAYTERDTNAPAGELRELKLDGVRLLECVHQREYGDVRETWRQDDAARSFAAILERERPDVVHFQHFANWGARCISHARDMGCATVITMHDYFALCDRATMLDVNDSLCSWSGAENCRSCLEPHPFDRSVWQSAELSDCRQEAMRERIAYHQEHLRAAQRVIVPSYFLAEVMLAARLVDAEQVVHLKAGYPGPLRECRVFPDDRPLRVGYVGGLFHAKGVHVLVAAMRELEGVELHVHGPTEWFPDYVDELRSAARELPVTLHGRYEPRELDRVLAELDLIVLPSLWYENMPLTLHEAWRNGIPVIATDLGGMAESVRHGTNGLLVPRGDASALASAIRSLAEDRAYLTRLAHGRPVLATVEGVTERLEQLYASCLDQIDRKQT